MPPTVFLYHTTFDKVVQEYGEKSFLGETSLWSH